MNSLANHQRVHSLLWGTMRSVRIPVVGLTALLGLSIAIASDTPYRLAGSIVTTDDGIMLALVETPDGTQQLLREGDSLDDGTVVEITENTVRLQFETEEVVLKLAGTDNPEAGMSMQYRMEDYAASETKPLGMEALAAISELAATAEPMDSKKLASQVLSYLDLPSEARIMAVNDQQVASAAEALQEMAASIDAKTDQGAGFLFRISVAATGGNKRVYIMADDSG